MFDRLIGICSALSDCKDNTKDEHYSGFRDINAAMDIGIDACGSNIQIRDNKLIYIYMDKMIPMAFQM